MLAARLGQGQTDQATRVLDHEIDRFGRDVLGGDDDVAFVFAIFLVDQDDHLAGTNVGDDVLDRSDISIGRCHQAASSGLSMRST